MPVLFSLDNTPEKIGIRLRESINDGFEKI